MPSGFRISNTSSGWANTDFDDVFVSRDLFTDGGAWYLGGTPAGAPLSGDYVSTPRQVTGGGTNWKMLMNGYLFNHGVKYDGTLWAQAGFNPQGASGTNTTGISFTFAQLGTDTNWEKTAQFSSGRSQTGAIKTDGTLWMWGRNDNNNLGDGTTIHRSSPIQIGTGTNWHQLASGGYFAGGIKTDGTLWMWGANGDGNLGDNTVSRRATPTQIPGTDWKQLTTGRSHSGAIKEGSTLWMWGANGGLLGDNSSINRSSPVQIAGTNWKQVSASRYHSAAIKIDGTLWLWGSGADGRLGTDDTITRSSPVQTISGGTNWKSVSAARRNTAANKTDGTIWVWGNSRCGVLGVSSTSSRSSPSQVFGGGTNWAKLMSAYESVSAVRIDCW